MDKCPMCEGNMLNATTFDDLHNKVSVYRCEDCFTHVIVPMESPEVTELLRQLKEARLRSRN